MSLPPLPVTVISGYLGAGKTTLVNAVLRRAAGRRIMVLVNDFGDLDIDADLLESADEDTLTLSNGCICCTMGLDLMYALSEACDRRPRPDVLVIEASGVAEPDKIAAAAEAEPELAYGGIVTLADAVNIADRLGDPLIGAQVAGQIRVADLVLITKGDLANADAARDALFALTQAPVLITSQGNVPIDLILAPVEAPRPPGARAKPMSHEGDYQAWSRVGGRVSLARLKRLLDARPDGPYRIKGHVMTDRGPVEAQKVGKIHSVVPLEPNVDQNVETRIVGIGVAGQFDAAAWDRAWRRIELRDPDGP